MMEDRSTFRASSVPAVTDAGTSMSHALSQPPGASASTCLPVAHSEAAQIHSAAAPDYVERRAAHEPKVEASLADAGRQEAEYDDGLTFVQHMIAGSIAGMVEHMAMFPMDTVKTRMQAMREAASVGAASGATAPRVPLPGVTQLYSAVSTSAVGASSAASAADLAGSPSVYRALTQILRSEGAMGLYRGIGAMGLGAGPAHAVYFAVYELAKDRLGGNEKGHRPLAHATAGALATVASDAVFTPMDVVKQRLQLRRSPYSGVVDCCRKMMEQEGARAFYASYRTTIVMNVPFTAVHFAAYEAAKRGLGELGSGRGIEASEDHLLTHLVAGGAAGALASAVTNPLDVVKTRLQCQGVCGSRRFRSGSVLGAMSSLVKEEGPRVLWRGVGARVLFHTPAAAIVWSTYEACKAFLKDTQHT